MSVEVVDLSHPINSGMPVFPGDPEPRIEKLASIKKDGYNASMLQINSHLGTHIDSPFHILGGGKSLDEFSLQQFIGRGLCVDCLGQNQITVKLIESYLNNREIDFLLFYTGWGKFWNTSKYFSEFPVLEKKAAEWICGHEIKAVGIDACSFDPIDGELHSHNLLLEKNILLIENLCNLHTLLNKEFEFYCFPLNYSKADGSPVRACAKLIDEA